MPGLKLEPKLGVSSYPGPKTGNCIWADLALPALRTKHARIVGAATRTTEDFDHIQTVFGLSHLQRSNTPISDRLQQRQGTRALVMVRWLTVPHKQGLGEPDACPIGQQTSCPTMAIPRCPSLFSPVTWLPPPRQTAMACVCICVMSL